MSEFIPGFRFYPTEEELISFYLVNKLEGIREDVMDSVIPVLNIYDFIPSNLQQYSGPRCGGDPEQCFFFIPRQESEVRGGRPSRLTETGFWKATGSPSYVYSSESRIIGLKRTMVFYTGRAPQGTKTHWKMNEYKAIQGDFNSSSSSSPSSISATPTLRQEYSLCRVYKKTKCVRAFDRRPTRVQETMTYPRVDFSYHQYDQPESSMFIASSSTTTYQQNQNQNRIVAPPPEIASSHDGSTAASSPENPQSGGGGGGSGLAGGDEAFWVDWDTLTLMEEDK